MDRKRTIEDSSDEEQELNKNHAKRARKIDRREIPDDDLVCILCCLCN